MRLPRGRFWLSMFNQLADAGRGNTIAEVVSCAPDNNNVALLRRIDVAIWMHAEFHLDQPTI